MGKVLPTALRLFLAEGGSALTPTRLHRETGVSRATIYRNWPDPDDLIEVLLARATDHKPGQGPLDDLSADLNSAMDTVVRRLLDGPVRAFFAACVEYGRRSDRIADAAETFITSLLSPLRFVLEQAVETGLLVGEPDDLVTDLAGPIVLEHIVLGHPIDRGRGHRLVTAFLAAHGH